MEKTLHLIALYNSQIIQVGFGIVLLLIVVYVYRIFFVSNVAERNGQESFNMEALEKKLNIIIDQQKQRSPAAIAQADSASSSDGGATPEEVDKLKAEIYNLRQQISENEKKSDEAKPASIAAASGSRKAEPAAESAAEPAAESAKSVQLESKITELQSRLSEYEIIADDIAELSQLRTENAKLIQQLATAKAGVSTLEVAAESAEPEKSSNATETIDSMIEPVQPSIEDTMGIDSTVSARDQNSIDDFEKNVLKKENE